MLTWSTRNGEYSLLTLPLIIERKYKAAEERLQQSTRTFRPLHVQEIPQT